MRDPFVFVWLSLVVGACGHAPVFRPSSSMALGLPPVTNEAVEIYDGDNELFLACGFIAIGDYFFADETYRGERPHHYAALLGGTHLRLVSVSTHAYGSRSSVSTAGPVAFVSTTDDVGATYRWRVYRLEPKQLACLPEKMRPLPIADAPAPPQPVSTATLYGQ